MIRKLDRWRRDAQQGGNRRRGGALFAVTETTWYRWKNTYGGINATDAKRLKELETENKRLEKIVAGQALDIDMLKEIASGNF